MSPNDRNPEPRRPPVWMSMRSNPGPALITYPRTENRSNLPREVSRPSPDLSILDTFKQKVKDEWTRPVACQCDETSCVCRREFVNFSQVESWMRQEVQSGRNSSSNLGRLLNALESKVDRPPFEFDESRISQKEDPCLRVFCILLMQGRAELIQSFCNAGVVDKDIAVLRGRIRPLRRELRRWKTPQETETIINEFESARQGAIPAELHLEMAQNFEGGGYILPFCRYRKINGKGGQAGVFEAFIQQDLVKDLDLRAALIRSKVPDKDYGPCFRVAIKSYSESKILVYETERRAFTGLKRETTRENPAIVRCLGHYKHEILTKSPPYTDTKLTYNIVLEYGEADLEECWAEPTTVPPVRFEEIRRYWANLFNIAYAILVIHQVHRGYDDVANRLLLYDGWHADVKPDNILSVDGRFKLADFGFARFKRSETNGTAPLEVMDGGTDTYGAPEFSRWAGEPTSVNQTIDIWSFGCVLSVTATWIVLGYQGVLQYQELRRLNSQDKRSDRFHNGQDVLPQIANWHEFLRSHLRVTDTITGLVLNLVDQKMLKKDPSDRLTSTMLCEELEKLIGKACRDYEKKIDHNEVSPITKAVGEVLLVMEEVATVKNSTNQQGGSSTDIKVHLRSNKHPSTGFEVTLNPSHRLSSRNEKAETIRRIPLAKTSHREEALREELQGQAHLTARRASSINTIDDRYRNESVNFGPIRLSRASRRQVPLRSSSDPENSSTDAYPLKGIERRNTTIPPDPLDVNPTNTFGSFPFMAEYSSEDDEDDTVLSGGSSLVTPPRDIWDLGFDIVRVRKDLEDWKKKDRERVFRSWWGVGPVGSGVFYKELSKVIKGRDMVFVVDNDYTMVDFYPALTFVAETLAMQLIGLDEDGIDLKFTIKKENADARLLKWLEGIKTLRKNLVLARPTETNPKHPTNIASVLEEIFDEYRNLPFHKPTTLMVLTNGLWLGNDSSRRINTTIMTFAMWLASKGYGTRHFSITFIRFGDDPKAAKRLRYLDDNLCRKHGIGDFIDAMTWRAPVRKMLLGSVKKRFDEVQDPGETDRDFAVDYAPLFEQFNSE